MSATKKVTCPCGCGHSFVPPSTPRKSRKRPLLTDDECLTAYAALPPQEPYVFTLMRFGPFTPPMQPRDFCTLCRTEITGRERRNGGVCAACSDRWEEINEHAAEVARQNAA